MYIVYFIISIISGMLLSIQGTINSSIGRSLSIPSMIFYVSLFQAIIIFLLSPKNILNSFPLNNYLSWASGLFGICIMYGIAFSISKLGTALTFVLIICSQLTISVIIDHFGLFGTEIKHVSIGKLFSLSLIGMGVFLFAQSK